jgi:8-hydroxy-5-deazaflavin:NADPH oxidoreductase
MFGGCANQVMSKRKATAGAKKEVEILLASFGYSVIDLGNLRDGGLIQQAGGPLAGRDLLEGGESHK